MSESNFHVRLAMALAADPREQREIAEEIGSSPQQVSRWKRDVSPSPDIIAKFVQVLGIDGHWLLTGEGSMKAGDKVALARRVEVIGQIAMGRVNDDQLAAFQFGVSLDKGQSDQLALQKTLETAKKGKTSLSDIERRLEVIERFEMTPVDELTEEEMAVARKLAARAKEATFGEDAEALGEGVKGV